MKKRIFCTFLAALVCIAGLLGCGKKTYTSSELMEMYGSGYGAEIWLYGSDADVFVSDQYYNETIVENAAYKVNSVEYDKSDMDFEQFQTKLQAALMSGKGPDLVITQNQDLFSDVNKVLLSGAFQSWDDYIADWDKDSYYTQALEGARASDGKLYVLPITFNPFVIVIPKENMQKYHLTEDDFSDFGKTTDTLLRLWEEIKGDTSLYVHQNNPLFLAMIPSICDVAAGKTGLMEPKTQELLHKWEQIFAYRDERSRNASLTFGSANIFFNGSRILDWCSMAELISMNLTQEQKEQLVFIPMRDVNQKAFADVSTYALLPTNCKNPAAAARYVKYFAIDTGRGLFKEQPILGKAKTESLYRLQKFSLFEESNEILSAPMNLMIINDVWLRYTNKVHQTLVKGASADWKDLEIDINIYLSE